MNSTSSNPQASSGDISGKQTYHTIYFLLSLVIGILYIYHNPAPWKALFFNFRAFFLILKPYTYYSHIPEFICIAFLWLIGHALGYIVLSFINKQNTVQSIAVSTPIGWGILSFFVFSLALMQWLNAYAIGLCLTLIFAACIPAAWKLGAFRKKQGSCRAWFVSLPWDARMGLILISLPIAFAFFCSLMPETQSDGLRYHLSVPKLYLQHGGIYLIPDIAFSNFPFLVEYIYTIPLAFGLDSVPKMIHASFYLFSIRLIYQLAKRMGNERCAIFAALMFASVPFTSIFASWSFIEMGLTLYTLVAFSLCLEIVESTKEGKGNESWRLVVLCGISGGFLLSCKYTALSTLFFFFLMLVWPFQGLTARNAVSHLRRAFLFVLVSGVVVSPWYIKNLYFLGNPVYPFAGGLFPTPYWSQFNDLFFRFHAGIKGHFNELMNAPWSYWFQDAVTLPFRVTFFPGDQKSLHSDDFGSWQLGPLWLTLTPFLLLYRSWTVRKILHLLAGVFLYFIWAYTYRDSRFLLPALAITAPLFSILLEDLIQLRGWVRWCFFAQVFYCLLFTSCVILLPTLNAPWWVVSGTVTRDDYLEEICDYTRNPNKAFRWLKENAKPDEKVLLHGIECPFYCPNPFVSADWFNTDPLIAWSLDNPGAEQLLDRLRKEGIRYVVYYYGKIKNQYYNFYRFFRLPPDKGSELLRELRDKEFTRLYYPLAYNEWRYRFEMKLKKEEENAPNIKALEQVLDGGMLKDVFRYVYTHIDDNGNIVPPVSVEDGIVIYEVPGNR